MEPMSNRTSARRDVATANCLVRIRAPVLCQRLQPATPDRPSQIADIDAVDRQHIERHERAGSFTTRRRRTVAAVFTIRRWSASKSTRSPVHTTNSPSSTQSTRNWASRAPTPSGNLSVNSLPFRDHNRTLPSLATAPARASHPTSLRNVTRARQSVRCRDLVDRAGQRNLDRPGQLSRDPHPSGLDTPRRRHHPLPPRARSTERRPHHDLATAPACARLSAHVAVRRPVRRRQRDPLRARLRPDRVLAPPELDARHADRRVAARDLLNLFGGPGPAIVAFGWCLGQLRFPPSSLVARALPNRRAKSPGLPRRIASTVGHRSCEGRDCHCGLAGWRYVRTLCTQSKPRGPAGDVQDRGGAGRRREGAGLQRRTDQDQPNRAGPAAARRRRGHRAGPATAEPEMGSGAVLGQGPQDRQPDSLQ